MVKNAFSIEAMILTKMDDLLKPVHFTIVKKYYA
jgi:hypothetical protein